MLYKTVRRLPDGRRVSQFISDKDRLDLMMGHQQLEYKPNSITKAPSDSLGIFCYTDLSHAELYISSNTTTSFTGTVEVHEAHLVNYTPMHPYGFPSWVRVCDAIKLGKTVAKAEVIEGMLKRTSHAYH